MGKDKNDEINSAIYANDVKRLLKLLGRKPEGIDPDVQRNSTPLLLGVICQNLNVCKKQVKEKANVNQADIHGRTPLHFAVQQSNFEVTQLLIDSKALMAISGKNGNTAQHLAAKGESCVVQQLLESHADANRLNNDGLAPLHVAVTLGNLKTMQVLLDSKHVSVDMKTRGGITALHIAISSSSVLNMNVVNMLLKYGANVNLIDCTRQTTPLQQSQTCMSDTLMLALLDHKAEIHAFGLSGRTVLHDCAGQLAWPAMRILLQHNGNVNVLDGLGRTPLEYVKPPPVEKFTQSFRTMTTGQIRNGAHIGKVGTPFLQDLIGQVGKHSIIGVALLERGIEFKAINKQFPEGIVWNAVKRTDLETMLGLVKLKVDFSVVTKRRQTILHHAVLNYTPKEQDYLQHMLTRDDTQQDKLEYNKDLL